MPHAIPLIRPLVPRVSGFDIHNESRRGCLGKCVRSCWCGGFFKRLPPPRIPPFWLFDRATVREAMVLIDRPFAVCVDYNRRKRLAKWLIVVPP